MRWLLLLVMCCAACDAAAAPSKKTKKKKDTSVEPAPKRSLEVPIEIAAGPVLLLPNPPALFDQPLHFAVQLDVAAIISQELIRKYQGQVPAWARGALKNTREVRYSPWFLAIIPDTIVISPQWKDTGMYGAMWRPFGVSMPLIDTGVFTFDVGGKLMATALLVHSNVLGTTPGAEHAFTLVLRPGINLHLKAALALGDSFMLYGGWSSDFFVPQPYGKAPWEILPLENSLWHLGGPFLMLGYRFPLDVGAF